MSLEDDEVTLQLATAMLTILGFSVETAGRGEEAVALYKARKEEGHPFTAVILDICQPKGIGGLEAMKHLSTYDPRVKAIASSGLTDHITMTEPKKYGSRATLFRPYDLKQLGSVLHEVVNGQPIE